MSDRGARVRAPGPGPGSGGDADRERAPVLHARIAVVATIVLGQLWALTESLNAWFLGRTLQVWLLFGFQVLSFAVALALWLAVPRAER